MSDVERIIDAVREGALADRWRALTPFEQQVGLALWGHDVRGSSVADAPIDAHYLRLARQVAAAFRATVDGEDALAQEQFVDALRGGSPPEETPPP